MTAGMRGFCVRRAVSGGCCAFLLLLLLAAAHQPAPAGETVMVLDASRSMWGQVRKKPKHRMAHDAFAEALRRDERAVPRIGLVTYGSSSPARCNDVTVHFKPGTGDRETLLQSMQDIRPQGLTPIAEALRRAAKAFSDPSQPNRILLVADGVENCGGDPCNMALDLKTRIPGLTIDVIALRVPEADHEKLSCLAATTGGTFVAASTQAELDDAGAEAIDRIVAAERPAPGPGDEIAEGDGERPLVIMRNAPLPQPNPLAYMRRLVQIEPRTRPEPPPASDALHHIVSTPDAIDPPQSVPPSDPAAVPVNADPLQTASIPLPETPTEVAARTPEPDAVQPDPKAAQPELDVHKFRDSGRQGIKLQAKLTAGMRKIGKPLEWTVYKVEDAEKALWKQVAAVRAPEPVFKLPPGTYLVRARYGFIAASKMVAVSRGRLTDATFVLNAGGLRILSHLVFVDAPNGTTATHFIYSGESDENGMRQLITKTETQGEIIRLNAGRYRIISRLGEANSVVSTDVDVSPGVLTAVEVNHKAGVLTLEVTAAAEPADTTGVNMVVFDAEGRLVVRLKGSSGIAVLAPGRYTVSAELAGRKTTQDVEIRIGEAKTLDLTLQ